ncbi:MAG: septal ring lytic transglycosylase RlpA family protein [Candidatus Jidaibacter sp.]|nr:septal ring lytic transglycosylase RlpA family protein [Candidatus Jidaibacter sp.]
MKILKITLLLSSLYVMASCTHAQHNEVKGHQKPRASKSARDFDVKGENDLDLEKLAQGEIIIEEPKQNKQAAVILGADYSAEGYASWYGPRFHGKRTANGSFYNQHEYTAAHRSLPMPSVVRVVNLENKRSVLVVVNDRGPYVKKEQNRIIDLSRKAANDLGMLNKGVAKVRVEYLHDKTMALLSKFSADKKAIASHKLSKSLIQQVTHLNMKNNAVN